MNKKCSVSIIIPVYNGSNYMREAIDSALAQDYSIFEVIVVNDGSTDGNKTEQIAKSYGSKIRYFYKENGGVSSALNLGIKNSNGEWISWLSHDDIYPKDKLSKLLKILEKHKEAKFIYGKAFYIDENGKSHEKGIYDWKQKKDIPLIRQFLESNKISGCATIVHKDVFKKVGYFNPENKTAQDYEMWMMISVYFKMYRSPHIAVKSRWHKDMGTVTMARENNRDVLKTIDLVDSRLKIQQIYPDKLKNNSSLDKLIALNIRLGDFYAKKLRLYKTANKRYQEAWKLNPNLNNPVLVRRTIGGFIYHLPSELRYRLNYIYWLFEKNILKFFQKN